MKALKIVLILLAALIAACLAIGLMVSSKFTVSRTITINAAPDKVYALIADPRGWKHWSVWNQRDPAMTIEYSGAASGAGAVWAWKSKSQGDGRMTFTAVEPPKRLAYDLFFPDFGTTSSGDFQLEANGAATQVTWRMNGDMGANPIYRLMGLFMDKIVGPDFDTGLANLKALAEKP